MISISSINSRERQSIQKLLWAYMLHVLSSIIEGVLSAVVGVSEAFYVMLKTLDNDLTISAYVMVVRQENLPLKEVRNIYSLVHKARFHLIFRFPA